jgi:hypothetical protein
MVKTLRNLSLLFGLNCFLLSANAQTDVGNRHIEVFPTQLHISPYLETKSHIVRVEFPNQQGLNSLNYLSNFVLSSGIRVRYKWINFQAGARLPVQRLDEQLGTTKNFAIGLSVVKRKYMIQTKYESFSGFYLQNTKAWIDNYSQTAGRDFYIRPDLKTQSLFTIYNYVLNHKRFSNPAAVFHFERQKRAAFGIALGASHMYHKIEADSNLVPSDNKRALGQFSDVYFVSHTLGLQLGLMGTIPLFRQKHWYVTASIIPGYSVQTGQTSKGFQQLFPLQFYRGLTNELRFGIGYNTKQWFAGLQISSFGNMVKVRDSEIFIVQNAYFRISTGFRFGR